MNCHYDSTMQQNLKTNFIDGEDVLPKWTGEKQSHLLNSQAKWIDVYWIVNEQITDIPSNKNENAKKLHETKWERSDTNEIEASKMPSTAKEEMVRFNGDHRIKHKAHWVPL